MKNKYIIELERLINFGISNDEELTLEERKKRLKEFRDNLSYEKYSVLFNNLENYILSDKDDFNIKEKVISIFIEFIRNFHELEDNIDLFPHTLQSIYKSFLEYNSLNILLEQVYFSDICMVADYNSIANRYLIFLDNPTNDLFIHYCYSKIIDFNNKLIEYLDKTEENGVSHRDTINNLELEMTLKENLNFLCSRRS